MNSLAQLGRYFFAIPFGVFGIQYFLYGHYAGGLSTVPPWTPGSAVGAYLIGAFLVIAAISVLANWNARLFAALLGLVYLLCVLLFHSQHFSDIIATLIPAWIPARLFLVYFTGVAFIAASLSITSGIAARLACFFLGLMFFLWTVLLHAPRVVTHLNNGDEWSSAFVALAMAGASFLLLPSFSERT